MFGITVYWNPTSILENNNLGSDAKLEQCSEHIACYSRCELIGVLEIIFFCHLEMFSSSPCQPFCKFHSRLSQTSITLDTKAFVRMCRCGRSEAGPRNARAVLHRSPA